MSALRNRFISSVALLNHKIWRKTSGSISVLVLYFFMLHCWRTKVANLRYCRPGGRRRVLMGLLCVAFRIEFEHPVVLVYSCIHDDRLRSREMIGFTDDSSFLSWIQLRRYD